MIPVPGPVAPPPWYGPPLAVPQTSRLHAVCRLSPQLRAMRKWQRCFEWHTFKADIIYMNDTVYPYVVTM